MLAFTKKSWALLMVTLTIFSVPLLCAANSLAPAATLPTVKAPLKTSQDEDSMKRLQQAAEQGDKAAQLELGVVYINGDDLPQDFEKAAHWFLKSAEQGEYHAIVSLMLLANEKSLTPETQIKVEAWLKAQGEQLPILDLPSPDAS